MRIGVKIISESINAEESTSFEHKKRRIAKRPRTDVWELKKEEHMQTQP
jgi:hypothetical protein